MTSYLPSSGRFYRAVPVLVLLVLFLLVTLTSSLIRLNTSNLSLTNDALPNLPFQESPVKVLYTIEAQAARSGWTDTLHRYAGSAYYAMKDLPNAAAHWEAITNADPALIRQLALIYLDLQHWSDLVNTLEKLLILNPSERWAHLHLGLTLAAYDPLRAVPHLREAAFQPDYGAVSADVLSVVLNEPNDPLISMRVGIALVENEYWGEAELAFRQAAVIGYPYPEALAYLALARLEQGKNGEAWIQEALALGSFIPQVQFVNGLYLRDRHELAASAAAFAQAAALAPNNPAYYAELGEAYRLNSDYEQAERWLIVAASASNDAPEFLGLLARFYAQEGGKFTPQNTDAVQLAGANLPEDPELQAGFAWALHTMGSSDEALISLNTLLAAYPQNPAASYYKARVLFETEQQEEAITLMNTVAAGSSIYAEPARTLLELWSPQTN